VVVNVWQLLLGFAKELQISRLLVLAAAAARACGDGRIG